MVVVNEGFHALSAGLIISIAPSNFVSFIHFFRQSAILTTKVVANETAMIIDAIREIKKICDRYKK
jgi:hypothetical protein